VREFAYRQLAYLRFLFPHISPWILLPLILGAAAFALVQWKRRPLAGLFEGRSAVLFFGPWWYLACVAPLIVTYSSPRHLYLASAGVCLLIPVVLETLPTRRWFVGAAICLCLAWGTLLVRQNQRWNSVADLSNRARTHLEQLAHLAPAGSGLILDVPEGVGAQYLWLGSLPFVMEPPYSFAGVYRHFRIVERPDTYQYWSGSTDGVGRTWIEDRRPVLEELIAHPTDCYVVSVDESLQIVTTRIPATDVPRRLAPLQQILLRHRPTDSIFKMNAEWNSFWNPESR
jgi:hypothetical protein